jgi:hypothetical protein
MELAVGSFGRMLLKVYDRFSFYSVHSALQNVV